MENIHSETYSTETRSKRLPFAVETVPCVKRKVDWALHWIYDKSSSFGLRRRRGYLLLGFVCIHFLAQEARPYAWSYTFSNELIAWSRVMPG